MGNIFDIEYTCIQPLKYLLKIQGNVTVMAKERVIVSGKMGISGIPRVHALFEPENFIMSPISMMYHIIYLTKMNCSLLRDIIQLIYTIYIQLIYTVYRGANIAESFLPKHFGDIGRALCTEGLYHRKFLQEKFRDIGAPCIIYCSIFKGVLAGPFIPLLRFWYLLLFPIYFMQEKNTKDRTLKVVVKAQ